MIAGDVEPPRLDLTNQRILMRHCFAEILTEYLRWLNTQMVGATIGQFKMGGKVSLFFEETLNELHLAPGLHLPFWLKEPLSQNACRQRLLEAFPDQVQDETRAQHFLDWIADIDSERNPLVRERVRNRVHRKTWRGSRKARSGESPIRR